VGKTALIERYVHTTFSNNYLSTVSVKISKKITAIGTRQRKLVLWDLEGQDIYTNISLTYLAGSAGFLVVADGTRRETLDIAKDLLQRALEVTGPAPYALLVNKADAIAEWEVTREDIDMLCATGIPMFVTSAKTGQGVEESFHCLLEGLR
jgi:small GTP-binding protein